MQCSAAIAPRRNERTTNAVNAKSNANQRNDYEKQRNFGTKALRRDGVTKNTQGGRAFTTYCRMSSATVRACAAAR